MDREICAADYGICLYSMEVLQDFLKREKIRSKKLLALFHKDKKLFLQLQKEGVWLPFAQIDAYHYYIKISNLGEKFDDDWEKKMEYEGFNIAVKNGIWISGLSSFHTFEASKYEGEGEERTTPYGAVEFVSNKERWYTTRDGKRIYSDLWYDIPEGKYLLSIKGYVRKEIVDHRAINYGFQFEFQKVDEFDGYKNPRESDDYEFNISWLARSKEAVIYWFSEAEGGRKEPPAKGDYCPTIELEDGSTEILVIKFDRKNPTQDKMSDKCRVDYLLHRKTAPALTSNTELIICDEIRKGSKKILQKVGRLVIK